MSNPKQNQNNKKPQAGQVPSANSRHKGSAKLNSNSKSNTPAKKEHGNHHPLKSFGRIIKKPLIKEAVKEVTAGGIVYRLNKAGVIEILLAQDSRDRWTVPKGHVEPGEITRQTAEREVREETDLQEMQVHDHLGKVSFQYRRQNTLVLMTMHLFLIEAKGNTSAVRKVDAWMNGIGWFEFSTALDLIHYEGIETLMLVGLRKIREKNPTAKISA